jgi:hypothetical protein
MDHGELDRHERQERWFAEGAGALRRTLAAIGMAEVLPADEDFYGCPCCLTAYGRDALHARFLTDEHVPPRAAGGKPLVLTCGPGNHTAGTRLDAHADLREAVQDLIAGQGDGRTLRAEIAISDIVLRSNVSGVGDALLLSVVPKANNPKDLVETEQILGDWTAAGVVESRFGFRVAENVSVANARLSWVRAAYLAAFAALGYRYRFLSQLEALRTQLANPKPEHLPR